MYKALINLLTESAYEYRMTDLHKATVNGIKNGPTLIQADSYEVHHRYKINGGRYQEKCSLDT